MWHFVTVDSVVYPVASDAETYAEAEADLQAALGLKGKQWDAFRLLLDPGKCCQCAGTASD